MNFGERFRAFMREWDLSAAAAGRFFGVAQAKVVTWREGATMPSLLSMKHICERAGWSMDEVMEVKPDTPEMVDLSVQRCRGISQRFDTISDAIKRNVVEMPFSDTQTARRCKLTTRQVKRIRREYKERGKL